MRDNLRQKRFDGQLPATVVPASLKAQLLRYINDQEARGYSFNQSEVIRIALSQYLNRLGVLVPVDAALQTELEKVAHQHGCSVEEMILRILQNHVDTIRRE